VLRGALDGLAAVPPYGDKDYARQRGRLAFAAPGEDTNETAACLDLDGRFGLNPALAELMPLWQQGELAIVHAAATSYRARSHFDGQDMREPGGAAHPRGEGGRTRALGERPDEDNRPLGLPAAPATPLILRGAAKTGAWAPEKIIPPASQDFLD